MGGAPRFRGTQARAGSEGGEGRAEGWVPGPHAKWGSGSGAAVGSLENLGLLAWR